MPNEEVLGLPEFPTLYGEEERKRQEELVKLKAQMEEVYQAKFTPKAWAEVPTWEKGFRKFFEGTIFAPGIRAATPWKWGFDYGMTQEEASKQLLEVEAEYKELVRRQRISGLLPPIQDALRAFALIGKPLVEPEEILAYFKLKAFDFTEEEANWLASYAESLLKATPEQLISGSIWDIKPLSQEEIEELFREQPGRDPRFILSTVAFSKDLEAITAALQEAYPPEAEIDDKTRRERILEDYMKSIGMGEGETLEGATGRTFEEIDAEIGGNIVTLIDGKTGSPLVNLENDAPVLARVRGDNSVWTLDDNKLVGYHNEETGEIVPLAIDGTPVLTEELGESKATDIWQAAYKGFREIWSWSSNTIRNLLPQYVADMMFYPEGEEPSLQDYFKSKTSLMKVFIHKVFVENLDDKTRVALEERVAEFKEEHQTRYDAEWEIWYQWMEERPWLKPREEWAGGTLEAIEREGLGLLKDPAYIAYIVAENSAFQVAFWGASAAVGIPTHNPHLGMFAGVLATMPYQQAELYEALIDAGATTEQAREMAVPIGAISASVEVVGAWPLLKAIGAVPGVNIFYRALKREIVRGVGKAALKEFLIRGGTTSLTILIGEMTEEQIQLIIHNAAVRVFDQTRGIFEGIAETTVRTILAVLPIAVFGGGADIRQAVKSAHVGEGLDKIYAEMTPEQKAQVESSKAKMEKARFPADQAEVKAVLDFTESEEGRKALMRAADNHVTGVPDTEEKIAEKVSYIESLLEASEKDVEFFSKQLEDREATLETKRKVLSEFELKELEAGIENLKANLNDAQVERRVFGEQLGILRDKASKVSKGVPDIGDEMPVAVQQELLSRFGTGNPGLSSEQNGFVYRDPQGNPIAFITLHPEPDGSIRIGTMVNVAEGVLKGKATLAMLKELEKIPNLVMPDTTEMSPEGYAFFQKLQEMRPRAEVTPEQEAVILDEKIGQDMMGTTRLPKMVDFDTETETIARALERNAAIATVLSGNEDVGVKKARTDAASNWANLSLEDRAKKVRRVGLHKATAAREWNELSPKERMALTLDEIEDGSLNIPRMRWMMDISFILSYMESKTPVPIFRELNRLRWLHGVAKQVADKLKSRFLTDPIIRKVMSSKESRERIGQEARARNTEFLEEGRRALHPENLTEEEITAANSIQEYTDGWKSFVRFMRIMRTKPNLESFKSEFPDAPETELSLAIQLKKDGDKEGLWQFAQTIEWGVQRRGYDPMIMEIPNLFPSEANLDSARGEARLLTREAREYNETLLKGDIFQRLATYNNQITIQWFLKDEIENFGKMWESVYPKFRDRGNIENELKKFMREFQGIPVSRGLGERVIARLWRQAMSAIFLNLYMSFRNIHQHFAMHFDRSELIRYQVDKKRGAIPADFLEYMRVYYDTEVHQLGGIKTDLLYMEEQGVPGLGAFNRVADRLSRYAQSDNIPRRQTFMASAWKAYRATQEFLKSEKGIRDTQGWIKDSGAVHFTRMEQNMVLQTLARSDEKLDLVQAGLRDVAGKYVVAAQLGRLSADRTHLIYERPFRSTMEMGSSGRTIFNLLVFPRGYFQRLILQFDHVFGKDATFAERRDGFKQVITTIAVGALISQWLLLISGRKRRAYDPMTIMMWQIGGLAIGATYDFIEGVVQPLITALNPQEGEEERRRAVLLLPAGLRNAGRTFVPFYRHFVDSLDVVLDVSGIDKYILRRIVGAAYDDYTPEELEDMDRNLFEMIQRAILGGDKDPLDIDAFLKVQQQLLEEQERLGEKDAGGRFYDLKDYGNKVKSLTKPFGDETLTTDYGFTELTIFYLECRDKWDIYEKLPSSPASIRTDWRKAHIEEEAMMLFWGRLGESSWRIGDPEFEVQSNLLDSWISQYDVSLDARPWWGKWIKPEIY